MEAVSGIASLSQLAVYLDCTVTRLSHLYRTLSTATFLAKSQLEEVHVLLKILERIKKNHSPSDTEVLVPVLISIAKIVQTLENWFGPSSTIRLQWNLIVHKADIEEALRLLRQKYNLLAFYYSERNNCALNRIESCLNAHHHAALGSSVNMSSSPTEKESKRTKSKMDRAKGSAGPHSGELSLLKGSTAPQGQDLIRWKGNPASSPSDSGTSLDPPTASSQSGQTSGQGGRPSKKKKKRGRANIKINVSKNEGEKTISNMFNNWDPNNNFEGQCTENKTKGGLMNIGNAAASQGKNGRS